MQVEALLFGQAGLLEGDHDEDYPAMMQKEYKFLQQKYKLEPISAHLWKFMRMRPANFPTVRIAQFAALVNSSMHLFSKITEINTIKEIQPLLQISASKYWDTHYRFGEQAAPAKKHLGKDSIHNIIINTIAPIKFLYAHSQGSAAMQQEALQLLEEVPAERNNIISLWEETGWKAANAAQTQSLLQLYNNYCSAKRCLECSVGLSIIRAVPVKS